MSNFMSAVGMIRQLIFPKAFRIPTPDKNSAHHRMPLFFNQLADVCDTMQRQLRHLEQRIQAVRQNPPRATATRDLIIELANQFHRLKRNIDALGQNGIKNKETRMLDRTLQGIYRAMRNNDIQIIDFTGQPFNEGQLDFEIVGEPERRSGLIQKTIVFCERPAVIFKGRLVQTGRGAVAIPA